MKLRIVKITVILCGIQGAAVRLNPHYSFLKLADGYRPLISDVGPSDHLLVPDNICHSKCDIKKSEHFFAFKCSLDKADTSGKIGKLKN